MATKIESVSVENNSCKISVELEKYTVTVLFSYSTPVAAIIYLLNGKLENAAQIENKYSKTTQKHIAEFFRYYGVAKDIVATSEAELMDLLNGK